MTLPQIRRSSLFYVALSLMAVSACDCGDETGNKASIESFTASPMTVMGGGRTTLTWSVKDATKIDIVATPGGNLVSGGTELSGSVMSGMLTQATTFTLTAYSDAGNATASVVVSVQTVGNPTVDSFTVTPTTLSAPGQVTLAWQTTDATSVDVTANGTSLVTAGAADGTQMTNVSQTTTFVLTAKNGTGMTTAMAMVTVEAGAPVINAFTATPNVIDIGDSASLGWDVTNADTITITTAAGDPVTTSNNATGTFSVSPTTTTEYVLGAVNANNPGAPVTRRVTVSVNPPNGANIGSFTASPNPITLGGTSLLAWTVTNADRIEISDGAAVIHTSTTLTGDFTVNPLVDTTYTLTAFNVNGNATAQINLVVQLGIPLIRGFTVTPNPGAVGGPITVRWDTFAADSIRILRGTTEVAASTVAVGSQQLTLTTTSTTYYLQATNVVGGSTAQVLVYGQDVPVINQFTVAPITFIGSVTATIAWRASSVSDLVLLQDGAPVAGFPFVPTTTVAVTSTGTMHLVLNNNTVFTLVATSVAGRVESTRNVYSLIQKLEPNNTASTAIALAGNGSGAAGEINPAGDVDWYSFNVPAGGNVRLETSDGAGGCALDTLIALTSSTGAPVLVSDDDDGPGNCSLIDPRVDAAAANLAAGSYRVRVGHYANTGTGVYVIQVTVSAPSCGNSIVESGEQCDDGGNAVGDGCNATCQIEPAGLITIGQSRDFVGAIDPSVQRDFYQVTMPVAGYIGVETFAPLVGQCVGTDTVVTLLDANLTVLGSDNDDGLSTCSLIDPQFDGFAAVPAGTYWVRVEENGNNAVISEYRVRIRALGQGCGNGILETVGATPEICDDGNSTPGDGCDAVCNFEGTVETEVAGNNTFNGAGVINFTDDAVASGSIEPNTDEDWYSVTVTQGQHLDVFATVGSLNACPANVRLRVQLYDTNGSTLLADNTLGGPSGTCGRVFPGNDPDTFAMDAGTYFIRVTENSTTRQALPLYYLHINVLDPGCGNAVIEGTEACDDGNTDNADGCDAACAFEPLLSYTAPGSAQLFTGTIDPATNVDPIQIVVTSESYLFAQTFTNATTGACVGADTVLNLRDAAGTTLLGSDNDGGTFPCSAIAPPADAFARLVPGTYWLTVSESGSNAIIPAYELIVLGTPVDTCGNRVRENAEQCDDGNTTNGDGCDATCGIEPIAVFSGPGGPTTYANQAINPIGERDWYRVEITAPSHLRVETFGDAVARTCADPDTLIRLYRSDALTQLGSNDDGGVDLCSLIAPGVDAYSRLEAGTYWLSVEDFSNDEVIARYDIVFTAVPVDVCSNGVRDGTEFCDDGNTTAGDGCSPTCTPETTLTFTAPGAQTTLTGAITTVGAQAFVEITVTAPAYLRAETFAPAAPTCTNTNTVMRLYSPQGVEVGSDDEDGVGSCSLIQRSTDTFARLTPGVWFLRIEESGNNATIPAFTIQLEATPGDVCGDSITEYAIGEQCDDGNSVATDGCSATCTTEPRGTYTAPGAPQTFNGSITPAAEQDGYTITVTAESYLRAQIFENAAAGTCATADPRIRLLGSTGVIAEDDFDGPGSCSLLSPPADPMRLAPGTYVLMIEEDGRNATIANYDVVLSSYPVDVCGNTVLETGETCDDGNTNGNDGCSSACAIEASNGTANQIYGSISVAGEVDNFPLTVATTSYLRAETFSPVSGVCNGIDTVIQLIAANGTTIIGEDDDDGVDNCSLITQNDAFARLAPGPYTLRVHEYSDDGTIPVYVTSIRLIPVDVCGNGVIETGEVCDDGNTTSGDGCSAACQFENVVITEVEPNDANATANNSTLSAPGTVTVTGGINPATDLDVFSFQGTAGQSFTAQTYGALGSLTTCSFDTEIFLMDAAGVELTSDDEGGAGSCSLINNFALPATGTYFIRVERWLQGGTIATYYMDLRLQ